MAKQIFTLQDSLGANGSTRLWDELTFDNSMVTENGRYLLACSDEVIITQGFRSLSLDLVYDDSLPNELPFGFELQALVEGERNGKWFAKATQFSPFNRPNNGKQRTINLQPNIFNVDPNVDILEYVAGITEARISNTQGNLPESKIRVKIHLLENDFGGTGAFQSVKISATGEAFDV